jgi:hypothetical protein
MRIPSELAAAVEAHLHGMRQLYCEILNGPNSCRLQNELQFSGVPYCRLAARFADRYLDAQHIGTAAAPAAL